MTIEADTAPIKIAIKIILPYCWDGLQLVQLVLITCLHFLKVTACSDPVDIGVCLANLFRNTDLSLSNTAYYKYLKSFITTSVWHWLLTADISATYWWGAHPYFMVLSYTHDLMPSVIDGRPHLSMTCCYLCSRSQIILLGKFNEGTMVWTHCPSLLHSITRQAVNTQHVNWKSYTILLHHQDTNNAVSYTHLTLLTIYSV